MNQEAKSTFKSQFEQLRGELRRARDEIHLKAHLASMDAKDAWEQLQPRLDAFEKKAEETAEEASQELMKLAKDMHEQLQKLEEKLKS